MQRRKPLNIKKRFYMQTNPIPRNLFSTHSIAKTRLKNSNKGSKKQRKKIEEKVTLT
jgi:hypothetical protein